MKRRILSLLMAFVLVFMIASIGVAAQPKSVASGCEVYTSFWGALQNGYAALDIRPHRRYVVHKAAAGLACYRPESILLYSHLKWCLHRIGD